MGESTKKVTTDLVLLVSATGYYQEYETGAISDLMLQPGKGPHLNMILPERVTGQVIDAVSDAITKGTVITVCYTLGTGAREEIFEAKAIPLQQEQALLLVQNITAHEKNRKALYQRNNLLQTVIDSVPSEITAYDSTGKVTMINRAKQKVSTTVAGDSEGGPACLMPDEVTEYPEEELPLKRAFNGEAVFNQIVIKKDDAHSLKTYLVNAVPLKDEKGHLSGVVLAERDITDIKNTQLQLKSKIKDFDMFMYRASHDLKSPLAAMKGVLDFAKQKVEDTEMCTYLEMIGKSHSLLSTTVDDLISLTRISQKKVEKTRISLQPFVHNLVFTLQMLPNAKGIKVKACVQDDINVLADEGLLRAILQNLICNAVVHHREAGDDRFVLITVLKQPQAVLIEVTDNGPGIPEGIQDKIYDLFYRGNLKTSGTGLGLFIVKQAAEKMGATIKLYSDGETGATFSVVIPKR